MTILLSEIYDVTLKRGIRGACKNGFIRPTIGECCMSNRDFKEIHSNLKVKKEGDGDFTTINDAITAASSGDIILIYPGTYYEVINLDKFVHLKGVSDDPSQSDVIIDGTYLPTNITCQESTETMYIEGLTMKVRGEWKIVLTIDSSCHVVVNKCNLLANNVKCYPIQPATRVTIQNCYLQRGYAHILYGTSATEVIKTQVNSSYKELYTASSFTKDVVENATEGYGPAYGEFYN